MKVLKETKNKIIADIITAYTFKQLYSVLKKHKEEVMMRKK